MTSSREQVLEVLRVLHCWRRAGACAADRRCGVGAASKPERLRPDDNVGGSGVVHVSPESAARRTATR